MSAATNKQKILITDLEDVALQLIVSNLDIEDRKNLALTCKPLCNVVRSQWKTLVFNIYDESEVPSGISHYRSLDTVIWSNSLDITKEDDADVDWDTNPRLEVPEPSNDPELSSKHFLRLKRFNDLVSQAVGAPRPTNLDDLPPIDPADSVAMEYEEGIARRLGTVSEWAQDGLQHMKDNNYEDLSLAEHFQGLGAASEEDDDADDPVFVPAPEDTSDDEALMEMIQPPPPEEIQNPQQADNWRPCAPLPTLPGNRQLRLCIIAPLYLSGHDFQTLMFHSRPHFKLPEPTQGSSSAMASVEQTLNKIKSQARPLLLPYTEVDLGWFKSDGHLPSLTTKATMTWCCHSKALVFNPSLFGNLRCMRICVRVCEVESDELALTFSNNVLAQLTSERLPSLQELHIGRPFSTAQPLELDPRRINVTQLTRIVLNEMVSFDNFEQFTHLKALKSLAVAMPAAVFESQPQDLETLSSLRELRSLKVEFWQVESHQDIAALQQLTELELTGCEGRPNFLKPNRPMPNLVGVAFTQLPHHQDMRYWEDSKLCRWALRHAVQVFPNVEVLHLGTLGSAPRAVHEEDELYKAAEIVDSIVRPLLAAGGNTLNYLQLDTVLNIMDDALDKRCETGSVHLTSTLEVVPREAPPFGQGSVVATQTQAQAQQEEGAISGSEAANAAEDAAAEDDDDEEMQDVTGAAASANAEMLGADGPTVQWERVVEFQTCEPTDVLVAEFHYRRVVVEEPSSRVQSS